MSVDSAYFIEKYVADNEVKYIFEFESIGSEALFVYIIAGGVRTLLPNTEYSVEFGFRPPIHTRGEITLDVPLSEGEFLQVERQTPITNESVFPPGKPFEANTFEFALDKITFIQQELEGSLCDCRGFNSINPACQPYACDAYRTALVGGAATYVWLLDEDDSNLGDIVTEVGGYQELVIGTSIGMDGPIGDTVMDACEGQTGWLVRENVVSNTAWFQIIGNEGLTFSGTSFAVVAKSRPGRSAAGQIAQIQFKGKNDTSQNEFTIIQAVRLESTIEGVVTSVSLILQPQSGTGTVNVPLPTPIPLGDPMLIAVTLTNDEASITIRSKSGINFSASHIAEDPYVPLTGQGDINQVVMLTNVELLIETIGLNPGKSKPGLTLAFERNFTDYVVPEDCP